MSRKTVDNFFIILVNKNERKNKNMQNTFSKNIFILTGLQIDTHFIALEAQHKNNLIATLSKFINIVSIWTYAFDSFAGTEPTRPQKRAAKASPYSRQWTKNHCDTSYDSGGA
jgi:hypothetical protein